MNEYDFAVAFEMKNGELSIELDSEGFRQTNLFARRRRMQGRFQSYNLLFQARRQLMAGGQAFGTVQRFFGFPVHSFASGRSHPEPACAPA